MRVLDLGGEPDSWLRAPVRPANVLLLNLADRVEMDISRLRQAGDPDWIESVVGDACESTEAIEDRHFDLVYSNSVIEHVGGHERRKAFASAAKRLARHHWIQTPYRYFPIEPHMFAPMAQFLPVRARAEIVRRWPIGNLRRPTESLSERIETVAEIELLSLSEYAWYFPDSRIAREKVFGLTKSMIAIR